MSVNSNLNAGAVVAGGSLAAAGANAGAGGVAARRGRGVAIKLPARAAARPRTEATAAELAEAARIGAWVEAKAAAEVDFGMLDGLKGTEVAKAAADLRPALQLDLIYNNGAAFRAAMRRAGLPAMVVADLANEVLEGWMRSRHGADAQAFALALALFGELKNEAYEREWREVTCAARANSNLEQGGAK